jgi:hypothetical protein
MLKTWSGVALGVSLFLAGCSEKKAELEARWHFVGADGLRGHGSTAILKAMVSGTNAAPLGAVLSTNLARLFGEWALGNTNLDNATLQSCQPIVEDLMSHESAGEVWKLGEADREFLIAARLTKERAPAWLAAWSDLWAKAYTGKENHGKPSVSADRGWLFVVSDLKGGRLPEFKKKVLETPDSPSSLLSIDGGFPYVPSFHLESVVKDGRLRTSGNFKAPALADQFSEPWHVPLDQIRNPLISFVAIRSWGPQLLEALGLSELKPKSVGEIFMWGFQAGVPDNYVAVETPEPAAFCARAANFFLPKFKTDASTGTAPWVGDLFYSPKDHIAMVNNTPFPKGIHLMPAKNATNTYAVLAFMPPPRPQEDMSAELLRQLETPGLIYYDWEITAENADHWNLTLQNFDLIRRLEPPYYQGPGQLWLWSSVTNLGNTVTRVTQKTPGEFDFLRNSDAGLSAFELVELTRWVDGPKPRSPHARKKPSAPGAH